MISPKEKERRLNLAKKLYSQIMKEGCLSPEQRDFLEQKLDNVKLALKRKRKKGAFETDKFTYNYLKAEFKVIDKEEGILTVTDKSNPPQTATLTKAYFHFVYHLVKKHQEDYDNGMPPENQGWIKTKDFVGFINTWTSDGAVRTTKCRLIKKLSGRKIYGLIKSVRGKCRIYAQEVIFS